MVRIEHDLARCQALWKSMSPGAGPWDDWGLMSAFHDTELHRLNFLVREGAGQSPSLVPLMQDTENDRYLPYGDSYAGARIL